MPTRPPRACPRCGTPNCTTHRPPPWHNSHRPRTLDRLARTTITRARHHCANCGQISPHLEADHIIPLSAGGPDTLTNLQALCPTCHQAKTHHERTKERPR